MDTQAVTCLNSPVGEPPPLCPSPPVPTAPPPITRETLITIIVILTFALLFLLVCFCCLLAYLGYRKLLASTRRRHHSCCVCLHYSCHRSVESGEHCRNGDLSTQPALATTSSPLSVVARCGSQTLDPASPFHPRFNSPASSMSSPTYRTGHDADRSTSEMEHTAPTLFQDTTGSSQIRTLRSNGSCSMIDTIFDPPSMEWDNFEASPEAARDAMPSEDGQDIGDIVIERSSHYYAGNDYDVDERDVEDGELHHEDDQDASDRSSSRLLMEGLRPPEQWV
ncbi:uncharacterized protein LOC135392712 [Ornithodoros turicata]|uniref:uncharacterized protein LOC135392712 n=1 Tax=Ornithodoros turicata TaxID=34597 RepID=UPI00313A3A67